MNLFEIEIILAWTSLVIALVAAYFWWKASKVKIKHGDPRATGDLIINDIDVVSTAREQSRLNSYAACTTAAALIFQAISQVIGQLI